MHIASRAVLLPSAIGVLLTGFFTANGWLSGSTMSSMSTVHDSLHQDFEFE